MQEVNGLKNMNSELANHIALQLAVFLRHVIRHLFLSLLILVNSAIPLFILFLSILRFEITENYFLVRHWRSVGRYQISNFVLTGDV